MLDRCVHVEPLLLGVFARDDDVDAVPASQTPVGHREEGIGIRWQVHADDVGFLVHHVVDEARVLMTEAIVILPPDVRG